MTENEVVALVQAFRALVQDKYRWAIGTNRLDWIDKPTDETMNFVQRLNISLADVTQARGKMSRLEVCEILSTLFGWNPGTTTSTLWASYESLKRKIGYGNAENAFNAIRSDARRIWGIGSTKDLFLSEISVLIDWLDQNNGYVALQAISNDPKHWARLLSGIKPVKRPDYGPPAEETYEEVPLWSE